jgi:hypothetical protein
MPTLAFSCFRFVSRPQPPQTKSVGNREALTYALPSSRRPGDVCLELLVELPLEKLRPFCRPEIYLN